MDAATIVHGDCMQSPLWIPEDFLLHSAGTGRPRVAGFRFMAIWDLAHSSRMYYDFKVRPSKESVSKTCHFIIFYGYFFLICLHQINSLESYRNVRHHYYDMLVKLADVCALTSTKQYNQNSKTWHYYSHKTQATCLKAHVLISYPLRFFIRLTITIIQITKSLDEGSVGSTRLDVVIC